MDHAAAEQLDPAGPLARPAADPVADEARHGHLRAGLHEREVVRCQSDPRVLAEHRLRELEQRPLEVAERDALVHGQALHLMEHGKVRGIGGLAPVHAARRDDEHRRLLRLHGPDLHGGRLRAKEQVGPAGHVDVQRVLHGSGRMVGPDVEGLEVVPVRLDLWALHHAIPHPREHVDDLVLDRRERMQRAGTEPPARQRDVDRVGVEERSLGLIP